MGTDLDDVIGLPEAAEILGVTTRRAQQLAASGQLRTKRVGRVDVTTREEALRTKREREGKAAPQAKDSA